MFLIGRFIAGLLFTGVVLSLISIGWPRFTASSRPEFLQKVHDAVKDTPMGRQVSQVLGVSTEVPPKPIDVQSLLIQLKDWTAGKIQEKTDEIITRQAILQIKQRFNSLNEKEKLILQTAICQPSTPSAAN
jgi:hypothetical protein